MLFGEAGGQLVIDGVGDGFAVFGVDLVVPLSNPWQEFVEAREQRNEFGSLPAFFDALADQPSECERLFGVIPSGPAEQLSGIGVASGCGVRR